MGLLNYGFWKYFKEISDIPRMSGKEDGIARYLIDFAMDRNLKYYTDNLNNVVIWKEASLGYEYKEILGLQCHTDMICEKRKNSEHDFSREPINLIVDEEFIKAKNTTLGADNGIGIAYILAILDSEKIKSPMLECIFTVQEETTMNGVINLDESILKSKRIISFDNFREDEMWISSATAKEWSATMFADKIDLNYDNTTSYSLKLSHFKGGHSGLNIGEEDRGNPIKTLAKLLKNFSSLYISSFEGGTKVNIIPRNCEINFSINNYELNKITSLENEIARIKRKYPFADINLKKIETLTKCYNRNTSKNILGFINDFQNGAIARDNYGNVILSGNFAAIKTEYNNINLLYSIRYNSNELGINLEKNVLNIMREYNINENECTHILGYEQNENSKLIKSCENLYLKTFNRNIKKVKVQACLECGYFADKIPNLQFIAIAPNIYDAHSPSERMSIKSANKMWNFIVDLIEKIR